MNTPNLDQPVHTIEALCIRSHQISLEKGWVTEAGDPRSYATITDLNHSELSEAMEEHRNHAKLNETYYEVRGVKLTKAARAASTEPASYDVAAWKPCGIPIELADFVIRVCQHVGTAGLGDVLQSHVAERHAPVYDTFDELLAELHLSVSLAYKEYSTTKTEEYLQPLADALSEVFAFCKANGIDLWSAIDEKEAYNRTRGHKHGGKAC